MAQVPFWTDGDGNQLWTAPQPGQRPAGYQIMSDAEAAAIQAQNAPAPTPPASGTYEERFDTGIDSGGGAGGSLGYFDTGSGEYAPDQMAALEAFEAQRLQAFREVWDNPDATPWERVQALETYGGIEAVAYAREQGFLQTTPEIDNYIFGKETDLKEGNFSFLGEDADFWGPAIIGAGFGAAAAPLGAAFGATGSGATAGAAAGGVNALLTEQPVLTGALTGGAIGGLGGLAQEFLFGPGAPSGLYDEGPYGGGDFGGGGLPVPTDLFDNASAGGSAPPYPSTYDPGAQQAPPPPPELEGGFDPSTGAGEFGQNNYLPDPLLDPGTDYGNFDPSTGATVNPGTAGSVVADAGTVAAVGAGGVATGSALSRIYDGTATTADYVSLLGGLGAAGLGYVASDRASERLDQLARDYMALGAPSRARYEASFDPSFQVTDLPGFQQTMDTSWDTALRRLSATGGNPFGNPGGLTEAQKYVVGNVGLPALSDYRRLNAGAGGLAALTSAAPGVATGAIGADAGRFDAIGGALAELTQPRRPSLWDLLTSRQGLA